MPGRNLSGRRKDAVEIAKQVPANLSKGAETRLVLITVIAIAGRVQCERRLELAKEAVRSAAESPKNTFNIPTSSSDKWDDSNAEE
jgi:hypothetical protein